MSHRVKSLNICSLNCNSLYAVAKKAELNSTIKILKPDILLLQETGLYVKNTLYFKNYNIIRTHKCKVNKILGSAIMAKTKFKFQQHIFQNIIHLQYTAAKFFFKHDQILVVSLYMPTKLTNEQFNHDMTEIYRQTTGQPTIIGGDLNARHLNWDTCLNGNGRKLERWTELHLDEFTLMSPTEETFRTGSVLDHFLVSNDIFDPEQTGPVSVYPTFSDHHLIKMKILLKSPIYTIEQKPDFFRNYKKADWMLFKHRTHNLLKTIHQDTLKNFAEETTRHEIDELVAQITRVIKEEADRAIPLREKLQFGQVELDVETVRLIGTRRKLKKALMRENKKILPNQHHRARLRNGIATLSRKIEYNTTEVTKTHFSNRVKAIRANRTNFFNEVNRLTGRKKRDPITNLNINGCQNCDPTVMAQHFAEYYEQLFSDTIPAPRASEVSDMTNRIKNKMDTIQLAVKVGKKELLKITEQVQMTVKSMKNKKSAGPDGISNAVIKKLPPPFQEIMAIILAKCLEVGYFPTSWKEATIVPIKKQSLAKTPKDFRPISLTNNLGKILEHYLLDLMRGDLDDILPDYQFGFRKGHSTLDALCLLGDRAKHNFDKGNVVAVCLLDIEKAFDSVWALGLKEKLSRTDIDKKTCRLIFDFLEGRTAKTIIGDQLSRPFDVRRGVPQGTILGPHLYNIFTSDMPTPSDGAVDILQYADDLAVIASSRCPKVATKKIEKYLVELEKYYGSWGIRINNGKTELAVLRPKVKSCIASVESRIQECVLKSGDSEVKPKPVIKYLGIYFDKKLNFKEQRDAALMKTKSAIGVLRPILRRLNLDKKVKEILYKQLVRPTLLYGLPAWLKDNDKFIEPLAIYERKIIRLITSMYRDPTNELHYYSNQYLYKNVNIDELRHCIAKLAKNYVFRAELNGNKLVMESMDWVDPASDFPKAIEIATSIGSKI